MTGNDAERRLRDRDDRLLSVGFPKAMPEVSWSQCRKTMNWDLRHRKSSLLIRLLLAVWIAVIVVLLCATGRWWGLVFVVPLVLDLHLLRRILAVGSSR
ncbi:MAG: hypothetical protein ACYCXY_09330 [Acidimicrobiales bacterium]